MWLVLAGPAVAAARWLARRRRGHRVDWRLDRAEVRGASGPRTRLDLTLDLPAAGELEARQVLVGAVVRCAERMRTEGDVYHLVQRPPWEREAELKAVGPQVQELAERLDLRWGRPELAGTTGVWLALPTERWLAEVVPPRYDPESQGEPEGLILGSGCRWGFGEAVVRGAAAIRYRLVVYVPPERADAAAEILQRAAVRLSTGRRL